MHGSVKKELYASESKSHMQHMAFTSDKVANNNTKGYDQGLQSDLFELYERQLKAKNDQEMKLSELLNQRLVYCFNLENENLKSRNSLRNSCVLKHGHGLESKRHFPKIITVALYQFCCHL